MAAEDFLGLREPDAEASIGKGAAALDIEQPVAGLAKRHAEARRYGRDPVAAVVAVEQVIARSVRPREEPASAVVILISERGYLALDTPHPLIDLVIEANLTADDESAVIAPEPVVVEADPRKTAVAIEPVVAGRDQLIFERYDLSVARGSKRPASRTAYFRHVSGSRLLQKDRSRH